MEDALDPPVHLTDVVVAVVAIDGAVELDQRRIGIVALRHSDVLQLKHGKTLQTLRTRYCATGKSFQTSSNFISLVSLSIARVAGEPAEFSSLPQNSSCSPFNKT